MDVFSPVFGLYPSGVGGGQVSLEKRKTGSCRTWGGFSGFWCSPFFLFLQSQSVSPYWSVSVVFRTLNLFFPSFFPVCSHTSRKYDNHIGTDGSGSPVVVQARSASLVHLHLNGPSCRISAGTSRCRDILCMSCLL